MTTYSTVIATRNRPAALALSLPLQLAQSRLPERIVVVDSSDNPFENRALVERLNGAVPILHQTSIPGSSIQRNIGLGLVDSDVTFFPDDDSLVHPDALAAIMRVYDLDEACRIGGVGGFETRHAPPGVLEGKIAPYKLRSSDRIKARVAHVRSQVENQLVPDSRRGRAG
jgi:glycosyltransferase involved in cell wall biosynthesis